MTTALAVQLLPDDDGDELGAGKMGFLEHLDELRKRIIRSCIAIAVAMLVAWRGSRALALGLYAATMIACVATYLHHATDTLKLSF